MNTTTKESIAGFIVAVLLISGAFTTGWFLKPIKIIPVDRPVKGDTIIVYSDISDICTKSGGKFKQTYYSNYGWDNTVFSYRGIDGSASCTKNGIIYDYSGDGQFTNETTNILK